MCPRTLKAKATAMTRLQQPRVQSLAGSIHNILSYRILTRTAYLRVQWLT